MISKKKNSGYDKRKTKDIQNTETGSPTSFSFDRLNKNSTSQKIELEPTNQNLFQKPLESNNSKSSQPLTAEDVLKRLGIEIPNKNQKNDIPKTGQNIPQTKPNAPNANQAYSDTASQNNFPQTTKKNADTGLVRLIFEMLFFIGLIIALVGAFLKNFKIYTIIFGIVLMSLSLLQYVIGRINRVKKIQHPGQNLIIEPTTIKPEEPQTSKNITFKTSQSLSISESKATPTNQEILSGIKSTDKEIKSSEAQKSNKDSKKNLGKKLNLITLLIAILAIAVVILKKYGLLSRNVIIIGATVLVLVSIMAVFQSKRKPVSASVSGTISKPSAEIENLLKNLKGTETEIDLLLDYINSKNSILTVTVAKDFGVRLEKIEEWARILESHNLIKIYYPAFGPASLKSIENIRVENAKKNN